MAQTDREYRAFLICDDKSNNLYVGRITRPQDQVTPETWNLKIGDYYRPPHSELYFQREK